MMRVHVRVPYGGVVRGVRRVVRGARALACVCGVGVWQGGGGRASGHVWHMSFCARRLTQCL